MFSAARRGGIVACEETVASSAFTHPNHAVVSRMNSLFLQLGMQRSLDFDVGDRLFGLMNQRAGQVVAARYVQPMVPLPVARRFLTLAAIELKVAMLSSGLLTETEAEDLLRAVEAMDPAPTAYYAPGRMAQVAGVVAQKTAEQSAACD